MSNFETTHWRAKYLKDYLSKGNIKLRLTKEQKQELHKSMQERHKSMLATRVCK